MSEFQPYSSLPAEQKRAKTVRWWLILSIFLVPLGLLSAGVLTFRVGWTIREALGRTAMDDELQQLVQDGYATDNKTVAQRYRSRTSTDQTEQWQICKPLLRSAIVR